MTIKTIGNNHGITLQRKKNTPKNKNTNWGLFHECTDFMRTQPFINYYNKTNKDWLWQKNVSKTEPSIASCLICLFFAFVLALRKTHTYTHTQTLKHFASINCSFHQNSKQNLKKKRKKKGSFSSSLVAFFSAYLFHCDSEAVAWQPAHHLD